MNKSNWLDDPDWEELKERVKRQSADDIRKNRRELASKKNRPYSYETTNQEDIETKKIEVKISVEIPRLAILRLKKARLWLLRAKNNLIKISKKQLGMILGVLIPTLLVVGGVWLTRFNREDSRPAIDNQTSHLTGSEEPVSHDPPFDIAQPLGREIASEKIIYNPSRNFVKYDDEIEGNRLTVSQQPLPDTLKGDPAGGVRKLADQSGAKEEVAVDGTPLYYSLSDDGLQTIILTKNDLLIFVNASQDIGKETLKNYANYLN